MTATKLKADETKPSDPKRSGGIEVFTAVVVHQKDRLKVRKAADMDAAWTILQKKYINQDPISLHHTVIEGVPVRDFLHVLSHYHLPRKDLLDGIGISERTLQRNEGGKLNPVHSGAALALLEITAMAERVLGNREDAEQWLSKKSMALNGERPLDLLTSSPGIDAVKDLLTRIEYGVYA